VASTRVRGCCPLDCQDSCSWFAEVDEGVVLRVDGARDHPITRGTLCAKVNDYQRRTYAPARLLRPLRRAGNKGDGRFEPIDWDGALDLIARRFNDIIREHGAGALLPFDYLGSMGVVQRRSLRRIFHALGAAKQVGSVCGAAGNILGAEGTPLGFDPEELVHSRLILLWGCNLLSTAHHTFRFMLQARKHHGTRLIAIDPRRTLTTAQCDAHLSIRPGTDHLLALALGHVLLKEGLADLPFAQRATSDLDQYCEEAARWSPADAAAACGIDETDIVNLAREFGGARPAVIRSGIAPQQTVAGEQFVRSLSALAILGGHWQLPGGGLFLEASPVMHEAAAARPDLGSPSRLLDMARLGEHLTNPALDPPVRGLMVWNANPAVTQPNAALVRQGLAHDGLFVVVVEQFMTDTARFADVILPSTTQLEHFDVQGAWGHHYISVNLPAIAPLGESKSHGEIMRLLAPRLGLIDPAFAESDEQIAASALPRGVTLDELKSRGFIKQSPPQPVFGDGHTVVRIHEVPMLRQPQAGLQLLTPKAHQFLNSTFANMPRQRKAEGRPTLHMHPKDAAARALEPDADVRVHNTQGSITAVLRVSDDIREGTVALPGKWWNEAANLLTPSAYSPGGQPAYNDTYVDVSGVLRC
jgi:anaerobic selenocysteine-containing dehydrogenase